MRKNKRRSVVLKPLHVLHIFCEGEKTEPNYFNRYKDLCCPDKTLIRVEKTAKNTPVQLVQEAVDLKKSSPVTAGDEYWVVFDRESPAKYPESLHAKAREIAKVNDIHIAISNVCFEVWLLLHHQTTCAACNTCAELIDRGDFKKAFPDYEKGATCALTEAQIVSARKHAKVMNKSTKAGANKDWNVPSKWNPYTNVYELLDAIDAFEQGSVFKG